MSYKECIYIQNELFTDAIILQEELDPAVHIIDTPIITSYTLLRDINTKIQELLLKKRTECLLDKSPNKSIPTDVMNLISDFWGGYW